MIKKIKKTFLCFILLIITIIFLSYLFKYNPQTPLYGVTLNKNKPLIVYKNIMNGKFQEAFVDWFGENWPFRSYFVKVYDQIKYSTGNMVNDIQAGSKGDLHGQMWIDGYLTYAIDKETLEKYSNDLRTIKEWSKKNNKLFLYIISPNKAEVFNDTLPWNYKIIEKISKSKAIGHIQILNLVEQLKIDIFDTTKMTIHLKKEGLYRPFSKTGIHWNNYGVCEVLKEYIDFINRKGYLIPEIKTEYSDSNKPIASDDDYKQILNTYFSKSDDIYPNVNVQLDDTKKPRYSFYAMTTSYHNAIVEVFMKDAMPFNKFKRLYYNQHQTNLYWDKGKVVGDQWLPGVQMDKVDYSEPINSDILVIEHNAGELPRAHIEFVHYLAEYIKNNKI